MSEQSLQHQQHGMKLPAFGKTPQLELPMQSTRVAESRLLEAEMVNPITYANLESCYNEAWRELKGNLAKVGFLITEAQKEQELAKSEFLIDRYPEIMKGKPKSQDSADMRMAYLMREERYVLALDRINMLRATEALMDGKTKTLEKTCAYMKKQMDLVLRSGLSGSNLYGQK